MARFLQPPPPPTPLEDTNLTQARTVTKITVIVLDPGGPVNLHLPLLHVAEKSAPLVHRVIHAVDLPSVGLGSHVLRPLLAISVWAWMQKRPSPEEILCRR